MAKKSPLIYQDDTIKQKSKTTEDKQAWPNAFSPREVGVRIDLGTEQRKGFNRLLIASAALVILVSISLLVRGRICSINIACS